MKTVMLTMAALFVISNAAQAETYPVLVKYKNLAANLLTMTQAANSKQDIEKIQEGAQGLTRLGMDVMKLYGSKNPNCNAQFNVFLSEVNAMQGMSLADVHKRYHDGVGLPAAPKHCYFGRSQIVHPVMNGIRLKGAWNEQARQDVIEDFKEVIQHLAKIQKNLDNPPN